MIRPVPHIAAMAPYALAQLDAAAGKSLVSLSQNESLRAPSPLAIKAGQDAMATQNLYPDPDWVALRTALANLHGIPFDGIACGAGSMELIFALTHAFADAQNAVLAPLHAYPFFRTATQIVQARYDTAIEENGVVSVDTLLASVKPDTRIVFIANPGNPTSTRISRSELVRLRDHLPGNVLLVIDEAYGEFADHMDAPMFDLIEAGNSVVLRTLSKAYGLAGMRVGWGLFPPSIASQLRKIMNPNNISGPAQAAATAAVLDQAYMRETCALTSTLRGDFRDRLQRAGFVIPESYTNFILIRMSDAKAAQSADTALHREGVFLRLQSGAGLGNCLRATVGSAAELELAAEILEDWARKDMT